MTRSLRGTAFAVAPIVLGLWAGCGGQGRAGDAVDGGADARVSTPLRSVGIKDTTATLSGHVQKGPFIVGSTLLLSAINAGGVATGKVFTTSTTDSLGSYSSSFAYTGRLEAQAQGYYWDEVTNALSSGTITLRALVDIPKVPPLLWRRIPVLSPAPLITGGRKARACVCNVSKEFRQTEVAKNPPPVRMKEHILGADVSVN